MKGQGKILQEFRKRNRLSYVRIFRETMHFYARAETGNQTQIKRSIVRDRRT